MPTKIKRHEFIPTRHGKGKLAIPRLQKTETKGWPPLGVIEWQAIGQQAPKLIPHTPTDKDAPLPKADVVVITWTTAEWAALDHVFCNSQTALPYYYDEHADWSNSWIFYSRAYESIAPTLPKTAPSLTHRAWGRYRLVSINNQTVLLFKSDMHLSTDGKQLPLRQLIQQIIEDSHPSLLLTIGTAGGARPEDNLGATNITNRAYFDLDGDFAQYDFNHKTFASAWKPPRKLLGRVSKLLMKPPVTMVELQKLAAKIEGYTLKQLLNAEINPANLEPKINVLKLPVLTTNGYGIGTTAGKFSDYSCLEMDDAVIGMVAAQNKTRFGSVRNISDPVVNKNLPAETQKKWSGAIYGTFGLYTSFNGALAAWAVIAGKA
jgi:nucleoside phosphorylase